MTTPHIKTDAVKPDGWNDRSLILYSNPNKTDGMDLEANVAISRDQMKPEETFKDFIKRQVKVMEEEIPQFDSASQRKGEMHSKPAFDLFCSWMTPGGRVEQRVIFISIGKGEIVTVAMTAQDGDFENHKATFNQILASLTLTEAAEASKAAES